MEEGLALTVPRADVSTRPMRKNRRRLELLRQRGVRIGVIRGRR